MMKNKRRRKGFISIMALLTMMLIFMQVVFILYMGNLQLSLSKFSTMNIKSNYISEDMVNHVIYDTNKFDGYFRETILKESRGYFYTSDKRQAENDMVKKENFNLCKIEIKKDTKDMNLELNCDYNDISSIFEVDIHLPNEVFEIGTPIININNVEEYDVENFKEYFNLIEEEIFEYEPRLGIEIAGTNVFKQNIYNKAEILIDDNNNRNILYDLENEIPKIIFNFTNEILLLNIKNIDQSDMYNSELIIGKNDNLKTISLKGVIYIEGDLIINQNIDFEGIIIINNGSLFVEDDINVDIKGMILYSGEEDINLESLDCIYDQKKIYLYASYLPRYINPQIKLIKRY